MNLWLIDPDLRFWINWQHIGPARWIQGLGNGHWSSTTPTPHGTNTRTCLQISTTFSNGFLRIKLKKRKEKTIPIGIQLAHPKLGIRFFGSIKKCFKRPYIHSHFFCLKPWEIRCFSLQKVALQFLLGKKNWAFGTLFASGMSGCKSIKPPWHDGFNGCFFVKRILDVSRSM